MNRAIEDYLKTIYKLTLEKDIELTKVSEIADVFGFTEQTVNEMIKKLDSNGLVKYIPYRGVKLTNEGKLEAVRLIRTHRIIELFLSNTLKLNWSDVHKEAERLEHDFSELVIDKLYEFLGNPKYCTHGDPIPGKDGKILKEKEVKLYELNNLEKGKIVRVKDNKELLSFLDDKSLKLGDVIVVDKVDTLNEIHFILVNQSRIALSKKVANMIYVIKV